MAVDRWWYRGKDLYAAYNTDQIFSDESDCVHSVLPAYYRNNVKLINLYQDKITALSSDSTTAQPPAGRSLKMTASAVFILFLALVSHRTYAKYQEFTGAPQPASIVASVPAVVAPSVVAVPVVAAPVVQLDFVQKMTKDAQVTASSFYVADSKINAVLHVKNGELVQTITLDDVRALGYVVVLQGKIATVSKNDYSFSFQLPN